MQLIVTNGAKSIQVLLDVLTAPGMVLEVM
jgi:hypothetical protein